MTDNQTFFEVKMCEMDLWNDKKLSVPPINTYKAVNTNIDINYLRNVFREGKEFFDSERYLNAEYLVLSRMVYRMKQKFRSAKDFKALEKLDKALSNYFQMDVPSMLNRFMDLIPSKRKDKMYLPTKNLLDYILVKLQGLVKLMERLVETSKIAAYLLEKRMHTGHFWKIAFIAFSLVSRIYTLARYTAKFVCDFYRKLLPFSSQLQNTSSQWLPQNYILPKDLNEWMNVDWLEFDDEVQIIENPADVSDIMKFFDLVDDDDDDVQFCDEYFMVDDDDIEILKRFRRNGQRKVQSTFVETLGELRGFDSKEDIGEVIKIEDSFCDDGFKPLNTNDNEGLYELRDLNSNEGIESVVEIDDSFQGNDTHNRFNQLNVKENKRTVTEINITQLAKRPDDNSRHVSNLSTDLLESTTDTQKDVTVSDSSILNITDEENRRTKTFDKGKSNDDAQYISDSESAISINETCESVQMVSDNSLLDILHDKEPQIFSQEVSTIDIESDEDVITVSDASLLETKNKYEKKKLKKHMKNHNGKIKPVGIVTDKNNEENIIIIPDTPPIDTSIIKKNKRKNGTQNKSIVMLDTPLREKNMVRKEKIGTLPKKVNKSSKQKENLAKVKSAIKLGQKSERTITPKISPTPSKKGSPKYMSNKLNNRLVKNPAYKEIEVGSSSVLGRNRRMILNQSKIVKSRKHLKNISKFNSMKIDLAIKSLPENSNIVNNSRNNIPLAESFKFKNKKQVSKKRDFSDQHTKSSKKNRPKQNLPGTEMQINYKKHKIKNYKGFNDPSKLDTTSSKVALQSVTENNLITNKKKVAKSKKKKKGNSKEILYNEQATNRKKKKISGLNSFKNKLHSKVKQNLSVSTGHEQKKNSVNKHGSTLNSVRSEYVNHSTTSPIDRSNFSRKRKRYWEISSEINETYDSIGSSKHSPKKKKSNADNAARGSKSLTEVSSAKQPRETFAQNKSVTLNQIHRVKKKKKKTLNNLRQRAALHQIGGKTKHNHAKYNIHETRKGSKSTRKKKKKSTVT